MFKLYPRHSIRFGTKLFITAIKELFSSGKKDNTEYFENKLAEFIGTKYAVLIPSARFGLYSGLKVCRKGGIGDGEVIMPAYTFKGMAIAVKAAGFDPVFIDTKDNSCNINEDLIEQAITKKTKAVLISHMFGVPCNMKEIINIVDKYNLELIEDCAHACGAFYEDKKTGSFGKFAVFSFGIGKNIVCLGGGALTTSDKNLYNALKNEVKRLPEQDKKELFKNTVEMYLLSLLTNQPLFSLVTFPALAIAGRYNINYIDNKCNGDTTFASFYQEFYNYRKFNNIQAAIGMKQLTELESTNKVFMHNAAQYDVLINERVQSTPLLDNHNISTLRYYYMIRVKSRDAFRKKMLNKGIDTKSDDMGDCSKIDGLNQRGINFPNTERLVNEITEIPNNISLSKQDINCISRLINSSLL